MHAMATRKRSAPKSDASTDYVATLRAQLETQANKTRAVQEKRYLKSELSFLGVGMPGLRKTAKAFVRAQPDLDHDQLLRLSEALWQYEVHELRAIAVAILELKRLLLSAADLPALIALVRQSKTWALVDWLATKVIGPLSDAPKARTHIDAWARDPDFWVRRTALLCHHDALLQGAGDFDHFARMAKPLLHEREFFIRKAIGWVLRSTAKRKPQRTYAFVEKHARELSGLSFREAVRALPEAQRKKLSALRSNSAKTSKPAPRTGTR
jgi:3-methyladenine DNA glycosylase AlkD